MTNTSDGTPVIPPSTNLVVGTDSYVTLVEANNYIAVLYPSTSAQFLAWGALSDGDKEIYLRNATRSIEGLTIPGAKYLASQALNFPRVTPQPWPNRRWEPNSLYTAIYRPQYDPAVSPVYTGENEVPDEVKSAQIEEGLELASPTDDTVSHDAVYGAIKSQRTGNASETYRDAGSQVDKSNGAALWLKSSKSQMLIAPFLGGSFRVL